MQQLLIEKTKKEDTVNKTGLNECEESPVCPACKQKLLLQSNRIFTQNVLWSCINDNCDESSFMRIKMGNKYFLIRP